MANDHLNVDAGAQGGDNQNQIPQVGGATTDAASGPLQTGGGNGGNAAGSIVGDNNAGPVFTGSSVASESAQSSDQATGDGADTKSDQSDYSTGLANDDLLASTDSSGMTGGMTGGGSVANATVSMGDVLRGAGAGTGAATGGRENSDGNVGGSESGSSDVPSPPA